MSADQEAERAAVFKKEKAITGTTRLQLKVKKAAATTPNAVAQSLINVTRSRPCCNSSSNLLLRLSKIQLLIMRSNSNNNNTHKRTFTKFLSNNRKVNSRWLSSSSNNSGEMNPLSIIASPSCKANL